MSHKPKPALFLSVHAVAVAAVAALTGCTAQAGAACRVNADCASGTCSPAGICQEVDAQGTSHPTEAGVGGDGPIGCVPNHDGRIERSEVTFAAGLSERVLAATNVASIDTAGTLQPDGSRLWDLSVAFSGDHTATIGTQATSGQWYASMFPGATYAAPLSTASSLLGVFQVNGSQLLVLGVVSPSGGSTQTELAETPALPALAFPLAMGVSWSGTTTVTGTNGGLAVFYTQSSTSSVDAHGQLKTPYGTFPVLRLSVVTTTTVGALPTTVRTFQFLAECYGAVAAVVSNPDESASEFTSASEVWRIAP